MDSKGRHIYYNLQISRVLLSSAKHLSFCSHYDLNIGKCLEQLLHDCGNYYSKYCVSVPGTVHLLIVNFNQTYLHLVCQVECKCMSFQMQNRLCLLYKKLRNRESSRLTLRYQYDLLMEKARLHKVKVSMLYKMET